MDLWFVRHFPTSWNKEGRLQGKRDIGIEEPYSDELSDRLAENISALGGVHFDEVYCSTLKRTAQTARLHGFPNPVTNKKLDELDFGKYEGQSKQKLIDDYGNAWKENPETVQLGETLSDLKSRVASFVSAVHSEHDNRVLVFGHGAWGRALKILYTKNSLANMNQTVIENGQLVKFSQVQLLAN